MKMIFCVYIGKRGNVCECGYKARSRVGLSERHVCVLVRLESPCLQGKAAWSRKGMGDAACSHNHDSNSVEVTYIHTIRNKC